MSEDELNARSWVLYALRRVMGYEDVRAKILKEYLKNVPGITIGRTFSTSENTLEDIFRYVISLLDTPGTTLFTSANLVPTKEALKHVQGVFETHYQTFLLNPTQKTLRMIDPARPSASTPGIYNAGISQHLEMFLTRLGFTCTFANIQGACQRSSADVFCQSWSLLLQIYEVLNTPGKKTRIPDDKKQRYTLLMNFYHTITPIICQDLIKEYSDMKKEKLSGFIPKYQKMDPCVLLKNLTLSELYTA